jgi:hypothetical protein
MSSMVEVPLRMYISGTDQEMQVQVPPLRLFLDENNAEQVKRHAYENAWAEILKSSLPEDLRDVFVMYEGPGGTEHLMLKDSIQKYFSKYGVPTDGLVVRLYPRRRPGTARSEGYGPLSEEVMEQEEKEVQKRGASDLKPDILATLLQYTLKSEQQPSRVLGNGKRLQDLLGGYEAAREVQNNFDRYLKALQQLEQAYRHFDRAVKLLKNRENLNVANAELENLANETYEGSDRYFLGILADVFENLHRDEFTSYQTYVTEVLKAVDEIHDIWAVQGRLRTMQLEVDAQGNLRVIPGEPLESMEEEGGKEAELPSLAVIPLGQEPGIEKGLADVEMVRKQRSQPWQIGEETLEPVFRWLMCENRSCQQWRVVDPDRILRGGLNLNMYKQGKDLEKVDVSCKELYLTFSEDQRSGYHQLCDLFVKAGQFTETPYDLRKAFANGLLGDVLEEGSGAYKLRVFDVEKRKVGQRVVSRSQYRRVPLEFLSYKAEPKPTVTIRVDDLSDIELPVHAVFCQTFTGRWLRFAGDSLQGHEVYFTRYRCGYPGTLTRNRDIQALIQRIEQIQRQLSAPNLTDQEREQLVSERERLASTVCAQERQHTEENAPSLAEHLRRELITLEDPGEVQAMEEEYRAGERMQRRLERGEMGKFIEPDVQLGRGRDYFETEKSEEQADVLRGYLPVSHYAGSAEESSSSQALQGEQFEEQRRVRLRQLLRQSQVDKSETLEEEIAEQEALIDILQLRSAALAYALQQDSDVMNLTLRQLADQLFDYVSQMTERVDDPDTPNRAANLLQVLRYVLGQGVSAPAAGMFGAGVTAEQAVPAILTHVWAQLAKEGVSGFRSTADQKVLKERLELLRQSQQEGKATPGYVQEQITEIQRQLQEAERVEASMEQLRQALTNILELPTAQQPMAWENANLPAETRQLLADLVDSLKDKVNNGYRIYYKPEPQQEIVSTQDLQLLQDYAEEYRLLEESHTGSVEQVIANLIPRFLQELADGRNRLVELNQELLSMYKETAPVRTTQQRVSDAEYAQQLRALFLHLLLLEPPFTWLNDTQLRERLYSFLKNLATPQAQDLLSHLDSFRQPARALRRILAERSQSIDVRYLATALPNRPPEQQNVYIPLARLCQSFESNAIQQLADSMLQALQQIDPTLTTDKAIQRIVELQNRFCNQSEQSLSQVQKQAYTFLEEQLGNMDIQIPQLDETSTYHLGSSSLLPLPLPGPS